MAYRIKRIDPFWFKAPIVPGLAVATATIALFSLQAGRLPIAAAAAAVCSVAVFLATKPALSGVFAVFGLAGGVVTFFAGPSAGLSAFMRVLATAGFSLFYMVLMDGVVLIVSAIYNLFVRTGFGALSLVLEA